MIRIRLYQGRHDMYQAVSGMIYVSGCIRLYQALSGCIWLYQGRPEMYQAVSGMICIRLYQGRPEMYQVLCLSIHQPPVDEQLMLRLRGDHSETNVRLQDKPKRDKVGKAPGTRGTFS